MKHHKHWHNLESADASPAAVAADLSPTENNFTPSPDEVSRKAYFTYVNAGAAQGNDVQHWLDAEACLIQERNRTRQHGFHNQT